MYALREICRADVPTINSWRADEELVSCLGGPFRYVCEEVDNMWFDSYLKNRGSNVRCAIVDADAPEKALGVVYLTGIDQLEGSAEFHIMIGDADNRGRGMGSFAIRKMLEHAFMNLNLHRVESYILTDNQASIALHEKNGFVKEGVKREAAYKNGCYKDVVMLSILREEYERNTK